MYIFQIQIVIQMIEALALILFEWELILWCEQHAAVMLKKTSNILY